MKRSYSLKGRDAFRETLRRGRLVKERGYRVYVLVHHTGLQLDTRAARQGPATDIRIAVMVSRGFGKAHVRNWAKRRVRAICREMLDAMSGAARVIIRLDRDAGTRSYQYEKEILRSLFVKAGIVKK